MRRRLTACIPYPNPVYTSIRLPFPRLFSSTLPSRNSHEQDQYLEHLEALSQAQNALTTKKSEPVSSVSRSTIKSRFDWRQLSASKVRKRAPEIDVKRPFIRRVRPDPGENKIEDGYYRAIKEYKGK